MFGIDYPGRKLVLLVAAALPALGLWLYLRSALDDLPRRTRMLAAQIHGAQSEDFPAFYIRFHFQPEAGEDQEERLATLWQALQPSKVAQARWRKRDGAITVAGERYRVAEVLLEFEDGQQLIVEWAQDRGNWYVRSYQEAGLARAGAG